jgi:RNA polymerase sigma-70 factor (ECF subfamily)
MEIEAEPRAVAGTEIGGFDAFFRAHFPGVARAAALVGRDVSLGPDLAQEAFERLYPRWDGMASEEHARNFVYRVAVNLARSHVRRRLRWDRLAWAWRAHPEVEPDPAGAAAAWVDVVEALGHLSPRQRACVVMVDYADLGPDEVADSLGMRASTVRVHLTRGRRALRERLGIDEEGPGDEA